MDFSKKNTCLKIWNICLLPFISTQSFYITQFRFILLFFWLQVKHDTNIHHSILTFILHKIYKYPFFINKRNLAFFGNMVPRIFAYCDEKVPQWNAWLCGSFPQNWSNGNPTPQKIKKRWMYFAILLLHGAFFLLLLWFSGVAGDKCSQYLLCINLHM